jgi:hypothetical protein
VEQKEGYVLSAIDPFAVVIIFDEDNNKQHNNVLGNGFIVYECCKALCMTLYREDHLSFTCNWPWKRENQRRNHTASVLKYVSAHNQSS